MTAKGAEITALYGKIGTLEASKATAWGVLEAARQVVRGMEKAAKPFPIEADPRIVALFTAKESAVIALEAAKGFLEAVKAGVGGFEKVSTFIVEAGLGGLVDVRKAAFEGQLNIVKGGQVSLFLQVDFMKQPHALHVAFNFHSPLDGAKALAERLLDTVK